jgi:hypothetical protein
LWSRQLIRVESSVALAQQRQSSSSSSCDLGSSTLIAAQKYQCTTM